MNKANIISAAQARLNFCREDYTKIYLMICEAILEKSPNHIFCTVEYPNNAEITIRIKRELEALGYSIDADYSGNHTTLKIIWG